MAKTTLSLNRQVPRDDQPSEGDVPPSSDASPDDATMAVPASTKSTIVLDLLKREEGASLDELVGATGWLHIPSAMR